MNRHTPALSQPAANPVERLAQGFHSLILGLLGVNLAVVLLSLWLPLRLPGKPGWPEAMLVSLAAIATLTSLARQLPLQQVVLAAAIIMFIGGIGHSIGAATGVPFGPFIYTVNAGPRIFNTLAWPIPLVWLIVMVNSRGVARLILRPWRKLRAYGFWVVGLTAVLAVLFDLNLEPFATRVKHYWLWQPTRLPLAWYGAPLVNCLGWLATALVILAFVTPALIDKRPRPGRRPPDYHPLVIWLSANALSAAGAVAQGFWIAAGFCASASLAIVVLAVRGAKW